MRPLPLPKPIQPKINYRLHFLTSREMPGGHRLDLAKCPPMTHFGSRAAEFAMMHLYMLNAYHFWIPSLAM